jgi:hypothetical protein
LEKPLEAQIMSLSRRSLLRLGAMLALAGSAAAEDDPLPSWNSTASKEAILKFVDAVTKKGTPNFIPADGRVALFDDDGTLWPELPHPAQIAFEFDCVMATASSHPDWNSTQPFKAAIDRDAVGLARQGQAALAKLLAATHESWTVDDYDSTAMSWLATTDNPHFKGSYGKLSYKPMQELIAHLRHNGFEIFIVSSNSAEFVRSRSQHAYGVSSEQIIAPSIRTKFSVVEGKAVLTRVAAVDGLVDDAGKPSAVFQRIGKAPIAFFGNADSDVTLLQWTMDPGKPRLGALLHHTDAVREFAYDRDSPFGKLDKGLREAPSNGWIVIDMKRDWDVVFP